MAVKIQAVVLWVITLCSDVFFTTMMEAAWSSEMVIHLPHQCRMLQTRRS